MEMDSEDGYLVSQMDRIQWKARFNESCSMKKRLPCLGKAKIYQKEAEMSSLLLRWVLSKGSCLNQFCS